MPAYTVPSLLPNANLKPELVTTKEYGLEMNLFSDRIGIDVSYYDISSVDQILPLTVSAATGYYTAIINAGELTNKGWEVVFNSKVFDSLTFFLC